MPDAAASAATAASTEFEAFMSAAVDAIIVIECDGTIVSFSRSAESMFGCKADEVLGKPVSVLMPEPYGSEHAHYVEKYLATGEAHVIGIGRKVNAMHKDGTIFPVWLSVGEINSPTDHRFVGILRDLSEQYAAEVERRTLETRLEHVSRLSLLGEMAAGIAHEINQPLTAIANYSQAAKAFLARGDAASDTLLEACEGIADQVQRAGDVITNLRAFLRKREVAMTPMSLEALIDDVMVLIKADAAHAGVTVETAFADDLPQVMGNAVQLQQVLLNLTKNAVDAMRTSRSRPRQLTVETETSDTGAVELRVSDRGPGVAKSLEEAIFHPFFTTKDDGLGVGLAISRSILEAHNGALSYEERVGGGATFIVSLPAIES